VFVQPNFKSNVVIDSCQFERNSAGEHAGAVRIDDSDAVVGGCTFFNNTVRSMSDSPVSGYLMSFRQQSIHCKWPVFT